MEHPSRLMLPIPHHAVPPEPFQGPAPSLNGGVERHAARPRREGFPPRGRSLGGLTRSGAWWYNWRPNLRDPRRRRKTRCAGLDDSLSRPRRASSPLPTFRNRPRRPRRADHLGCAGDAGPDAAGPPSGRGRHIRLRQHPDLDGLFQEQAASSTGLSIRRFHTLQWVMNE